MFATFESSTSHYLLSGVRDFSMNLIHLGLHLCFITTTKEGEPLISNRSYMVMSPCFDEESLRLLMLLLSGLELM